jgi:TrmH family RNA methyltransferase
VKGVLLHSKGARNQGMDIIYELCTEQDIEIIDNDYLVEKLSRRGDTYAVGVFDKYQPDLEHDANHVVLVQPHGMGNLGTITRTMLAFGIQNLGLIEPAADLFDPKVIRASMGAIFQLRFQWFDQFADYWGTFASHHLYPLMTDGEMDLTDIHFQLPYTLIFGEESSGLGKEYHQFGTSVRIPQEGTVDSLNIALSVGVTLYQAYTRGKSAS